MLSRREMLAGLVAPAACGAQRRPGMFGDAEAYERFMGRWSRLLAPQLAAFAGLPDSGRVLDVGSGTGALAFAIARAHPRSRVTGIDPSAEYVAYASSKNPFPGRAEFAVGDAQHLKFDAASFEAAASLLVFNFIPDRIAALREVIRVTKPGGAISAAVWDYADGMRMLQVFWDAAAAIEPSAKKHDESSMPLCHSGELAGFWKSGGLDHVEERPLAITQRFASFADYWDPFLLGQGPAGAFLRSLDNRRRDALRAELKRRLSPQTEDSPFALPARAWAVRGTAPGA